MNVANSSIKADRVLKQHYRVPHLLQQQSFNPQTNMHSSSKSTNIFSYKIHYPVNSDTMLGRMGSFQLSCSETDPKINKATIFSGFITLQPTQFQSSTTPKSSSTEGLVGKEDYAKHEMAHPTLKRTQLTYIRGLNLGRQHAF